MKHKTGIIGGAVAVLIVSLGAVIYPLISDYIESRMLQEVSSDAVSQTEAMASDDRQAMREAARQYNDTLRSGVADDSGVQGKSWYQSLLNVTDDGLMGILLIPCIDVSVPIYHGTDTLDQGIGHVYGTSLPIGGAGTHAALSGHSGMAGQRMLTDLPNMKIGDFFFIRILGDTLTYRVDQIKTVLPEDISDLQIDPDEDYVTLITCTPYGVNSHRLLVRGVRVPDTDEKEIAVQTKPASASTWWQKYLTALLAGLLAAAMVIAVVLIVRTVRKRKKPQG